MNRKLSNSNLKTARPRDTRHWEIVWKRKPIILMPYPNYTISPVPRGLAQFPNSSNKFFPSQKWDISHQKCCAIWINLDDNNRIIINIDLWKSIKFKEIFGSSSLKSFFLEVLSFRHFFWKNPRKSHILKILGKWHEFSSCKTTKFSILSRTTNAFEWVITIVVLDVNKL